MEFTQDNVVSASFTSNERNMIQVIYKSEDGKNRSYMVPANPERATFQKLMKIIDIDQIEQHTEDRIQRQWQHTMALLAKAERDYQLNQTDITGYIYDFRTLNEQVINDALKYWVLNPKIDQEYEEQLFSFKLALFDDEELLNSLSDEEKEAIRTSETFLDLFKSIALIKDSN